MTSKPIALILALVLAVVAAPLAAEAQRTRTIRIGWLDPEVRPEALNSVRQTMKGLGWVEGAVSRSSNGPRTGLSSDTLSSPPSSSGSRWTSS
jgi:hypothetical protein